MKARERRQKQKWSEEGKESGRETENVKLKEGTSGQGRELAVIMSGHALLGGNLQGGMRKCTETVNKFRLYYTGAGVVTAAAV